MAEMPAGVAVPSTPLVAPETGSAIEILARAEALGIPWRRLLLGEIDAEQKLQRYLADIEQDCSLRSVLRVLSLSCLNSWRARDQVERLACEARGAADRDAVRQLRMVLRELTGRTNRDKVAFAAHLWFGYQRVLVLQRVRRAVARSRGTLAERLAFVCATSRCGYDDAAWAAVQEDSPRRGDRFEATVRKVREEGFLIPRAETETRALIEVRRILRSSPFSRKRRQRPTGHQGSLSGPRRVQLPINAI